MGVSVSSDGEHWTESFGTSSNMLSHTVVALAGTVATKIRIKMSETHPWLGVFETRRLYGIRSITVLAPRLQAVLDDCATASRSSDARDKYFAAGIPDGSHPAAGNALRQEVPSLQSAAASLSATLSELSAALPGLPMCSGSGQRSEASALQTGSRKRASMGVASSRFIVPSSMRARGHAVATAPADDVGVQMGVDVTGVRELLKTAKSAIVEMRAALL